MTRLRILLANHHPIIRNSLRRLLEREPTFQVVGEAANGREAVVLAEYQHPDIILLEVKLPHLSGMAAAREMLCKNPQARILFVTAHIDEGYIEEAFRVGARGYVLGDAAPADLMPAIQAVARGRLFLSPALSQHLLDTPSRRHTREGDLSELQKELCCLLAAGYNEQEIAKHLHRDLHQLQTDFEVVNQVVKRSEVPDLLGRSNRL